MLMSVIGKVRTEIKSLKYVSIIITVQETIMASICAGTATDSQRDAGFMLGSQINPELLESPDD